MNALLEIRDLSIAFGGLKAVQDFNLSLQDGDLQGLIGPNGAGKTTVFNLLTGVYRPQTGSVRLGERVLTGLPPHRIAAAGLARTFQASRLFGDLTVLDNVRIGCQLRLTHRLWGTLFRSPRHVREERAVLERCDELLDTFGLSSRRHELARNLPYGDQRRLEMARALATDPRVLLLDEPAAGVPEAERRELLDLVASLPEDVSVLLIEHNMDLVFRFATRITVLVNGRVLAEGEPAAVARDPAVKAAYLGEGAHG